MPYFIANKLEVTSDVIRCWGPLMDRDLAVQSQQQESERERAGGREREKERKTGRKKDTGTQVSDGKGCIISRNAGLYIFSKMITQLLHRMQFYQ